MFWTAIGIGAAVLTTLALVPQIMKILKTKSSRDISVGMFLQYCGGVSLWLAYGIHLKDPIIIIANAVTLTALFVLLTLYLKYNI